MLLPNQVINPGTQHRIPSSIDSLRESVTIQGLPAAECNAPEIEDRQLLPHRGPMMTKEKTTSSSLLSR